jgi:hypothetical protein
LCVGGGDGVVHSSPVAANGFDPALAPDRYDHAKYTSGSR